MKRIEALLLTLALIFAILIISGCPTFIPYTKQEIRSACTQIEVGVTYYSQEAENMYRFTPAYSCRYIISVIGTNCELSWVLLNNPKPKVTDAIVMRSSSGTPGAEIPATVVLNAGQEYYIAVLIESRKAIDATFELSIFPK
jgi:hypothetical protein